MVTLPRFALLSLAVGVVLLSGCKKEEEAPQAVPLPSAAPAPVKAAEDPKPTQGAESGSAGTAGSANAAAPEQSAAPPPAADTAPPKPVAQASIDGCCSALAGIAKSGLPTTTKAKAAQAAAMCAGLAKSVKEGKASRSTALASIGATMGGQAPSECK